MMEKYKIGYVDENSDEVARYERLLRDTFEVVAYNIPQGLPLSDLLDQIYDSEIDLLMVDYLMVDKGWLVYNGDEVARKYREIKPHFPVIIFTNQETDAFPHVDDPNIIYDKSNIREDGKRAHFKEILTKSITSYKLFINKRKDKINELLEKGAKEGLSAEEKHELLQSQLELKTLDLKSDEIPYQLLVDESKSENLSKTAKEAEDYLASLMKKKK